MFKYPAEELYINIGLSLSAVEKALLIFENIILNTEEVEECLQTRKQKKRLLRK